MSKYGSGVSMKSVIEQEITEVHAILKKNNMSGEDTEAVLGALKEMAYQWCQSNAHACAIEQVSRMNLAKALTPEYRAVVEQKMKETFPDYDD